MATGLREARTGRTFIGRLPTGSDLVEEIERFAAENRVNAAWVTAVGAVSRASFAYYNQTTLQYKEMASPRHHEISGFTGNLSIRDGRPYLHVHANFADIEGETLGGHLLPGCVVSVAEVEIRELTDVALIREHDEQTGLAIW
jgi:uncharacterized protein